MFKKNTAWIPAIAIFSGTLFSVYASLFSMNVQPDVRRLYTFESDYKIHENWPLVWAYATVQDKQKDYAVLIQLDPMESLAWFNINNGYMDYKYATIDISLPSGLFHWKCDDNQKSPDGTHILRDGPPANPDTKTFAWNNLASKFQVVKNQNGSWEWSDELWSEEKKKYDHPFDLKLFPAFNVNNTLTEPGLSLKTYFTSIGNTPVGWLNVPEYNDSVLIKIVDNPNDYPTIKPDKNQSCNFVYIDSNDKKTKLPNGLYHWKSDGDSGSKILSAKPQSQDPSRMTFTNANDPNLSTWASSSIHPSESLWGLNPTPTLQQKSELGKKLNLLKDQLAKFKTSLESLKQKLVDLKNKLSGVSGSTITTKTSWKLHDGCHVDVTFDANDQMLRTDVNDENGVLIAQLKIKQGEDQGILTVTDDVLNTLKKHVNPRSNLPFWDSSTYTLEKEEGMRWNNSTGTYEKTEICLLSFPNGKYGRLELYKITQKRLDDLSSKNPYKYKTDLVGKYLPGPIFINNLGPFEWDSKKSPAADHQPLPPWIEISVRAFAEVVWPMAHGSNPSLPVTKFEG